MTQWGIDQVTSLIIPLSDLGKTICFYGYIWTSEEDPVESCSDQSFPFGFIASFIPYLFKWFHISIGLLRKSKLNHLDAIILGKVGSSLLMTVASFLAKLYPDDSRFLLAWIGLAVISSVLAYIADLRIDWGFFDEGAEFVFLREKLAYRKPFVYYGAMLLNLILRFTWVWAISIDVLSMYMRIEVIFEFKILKILF